MLNDITDSSATAVLGGKDHVPPVSRVPAGAAPATAAEQVAEPLVNPVVSIDATGLVVVQYREDNGEIRFQIPSEGAVRAYEELARTGTKPPVESLAAATAVAAAAMPDAAGTSQSRLESQDGPSIEIDA